MDDELTIINAYKILADRCGLSEKTIRTAFSRRPIVYQTACRIARNLNIPVQAFRIKDDRRGRKPPKR